MKSYVLITLLSIYFSNSLAQQQDCKPILSQHLRDYGYLTPFLHTDLEFKKSLRQFQRENNVRVDGEISQEICDFVQKVVDRQMVIDFLKTFNYFINDVNPVSLAEAVKKLQYNSGILNINGKIDQDTIKFVKSNMRAHFEPISI